MNINGLSAERTDIIWDTVCYIGCDGETFRTKTVLNHLHQRMPNVGHKALELSWAKFYKWAMQNPDEFSGPVSRLTRLSPGRWILKDGPEL